MTAGVFILPADRWRGYGPSRDHFALRFGSNVVWQDRRRSEVERLQILKEIESSDAVLIVIGPHWLKDGLRRLRDPKDVLRDRTRFK
jgi:hypothetical protein